MLEAGGAASLDGKGDAVWFLPVTQDPEDGREAGPLQERPGRWLPRDNDQVTSAEWTSHQANSLTLTRQRDAEMSHHSPSFFFPQVSPRNQRRGKKSCLMEKKRGVKEVLNQHQQIFCGCCWWMLVYFVSDSDACCLPFFMCDDTGTSSGMSRTNLTLFFFVHVESWGRRLSFFWRLSRRCSDYVMPSAKVMVWHSREHEKVRVFVPFGKEAAWYQPANMISSCLFHPSVIHLAFSPE